MSRMISWIGCIIWILNLAAALSFSVDRIGRGSIERLCPNSSSRFASEFVQAEFKDPSQGFGVFAVQNIPAATEILRIPLSTTIYKDQFECFHRREACDAIESIRKDLATISDDADELALALMLIAASETKDGYARTVLDMASMGKLCVDEDVIRKVLQPLVPELASRYSTIQFLIDRTKRLVRNRFATVADINSVLDTDILEAAVFAVTSRAFFLRIDEAKPREVVMVPCGDLFNHEEDNRAVRFVVENNDTLVFRTRKAYTKGEELFINYGDKTSEDLLFQYGFFLPQSSRSVVRIPLLSAVRGILQQNPVKQAIFDRFTLDGGKILLSEGGLMGFGLGLVRALVLDDVDMSAHTLADVLGRHIEAPNAKKSETRAAIMIEEAVFAELAKYKEVFDSNAEILATLPRTLHEFLIMNLRIMAVAWKRISGRT